MPFTVFLLFKLVVPVLPILLVHKNEQLSIELCTISLSDMLYVVSLDINCHFILSTLSLSFAQSEIDHAAVIESGVSPLLQQVSVQTAPNMLQS